MIFFKKIFLFFKKLKNTFKSKFRFNFFILKIYKCILFIPSIFFLFFLFVTLKIFLKKFRKIISLRISSKFFGHLTIEPAILSSYFESKAKIYPLVSFRKGKVINKKLVKIARNSFKIKNDSINIILEHLYNYSFEKIRLKIDSLYSPLIHPKLKTRETTYAYFLGTSKSFKWRDNARKLVFSKNDKDFKLVIALRTNDFNKKIMNPQPWRDASPEDISYICQVSSEIVKPKNIFLYYNPDNKQLLKDEKIKKLNINFIDETKIDVLSLFSPNTILINNGNGIGAAALAMGIKTLYINHTAWQFWHTAHANGISIPSLFLDKNSQKECNIQKIINLAFSTKSLMPLDFTKDYFQNGISINKIKDIKKEILIKTFEQILNFRESDKRVTEILMGCKFEYSNEKERFFWQNYIREMPALLRNCHQHIRLNISHSFLDNF